MAFALGNRTITKIGVIGSGQIGPDIALYFTKVLAPHGVPIVVVDISDEALAAGKKKVEKKISKGVESGAFKPDKAEAMLNNLTFTSDYDALAGVSLVVEAATEDEKIKHKIVEQVESIVDADTIIASNSSHMEPEVIFANAKHPERTLVVHYFFPAERNIIVEVVPGAKTDKSIADWTMKFYEQIGKTPLRVGSRYGYAIDPVFEGIFYTAALGVEAGWGDVKQVDEMARKALKLGIGPFTAMNLTGGNPITNHGLDQYTTKINSWFKSPQILKDQLAKNAPWETAGRGEKVEYTPEQYDKVSKLMAGAYFGIVCELLDAGISNVGDLDMGISTALVVRPPFTWMNEIGVKEALSLVEAYAETQQNFVVPESLKKQAASGKAWDIPVVLREDHNDIAVITIRRPAVLNALNLEVFGQLKAHCQAVENDSSINGTVIAGFGIKAFVSGADIGMLAALENEKAGEDNSQQFHDVLNFIEDMKKPVICAMNGLAFGGGNELAMACHARLAKKGLRVLAGQPEVNLGIIPGAGGTQRLPRLIGIEAATRMMRTAEPISSAQAKKLGLILDEVEGDVVEAAVELARNVADGKASITPIQREAMADVPSELPAHDIAHRSTVIDGILCRTILEGAKSSLRDGLKLESKAFGECVGTKDMHIGMENFIKNGPRVKAEFVNA